MSEQPKLKEFTTLPGMIGETEESKWILQRLLPVQNEVQEYTLDTWASILSPLRPQTVTLNAFIAQAIKSKVKSLAI